MMRATLVIEKRATLWDAAKSDVRCPHSSGYTVVDLEGFQVSFVGSEDPGWHAYCFADLVHKLASDLVEEFGNVSNSSDEMFAFKFVSLECG